MSEIADRYRRLSDAFAAKVAAVPGPKWSAPTPCPDWNVGDLVGHVVGTQGMFLGFIGAEMGPQPSVADDPVKAFDGARAAVQEILDDPARAATEFEGMLGRTTFETGVNTFLCTDLVVHGWDLARAAGLDETISPAEIPKVWAAMKPLSDTMRSPRAFGPEVEAPPDADEQTRLLCFLGRNP